jgi:hypothetical protein
MSMQQQQQFPQVPVLLLKEGTSETHKQTILLLQRLYLK